MKIKIILEMFDGEPLFESKPEESEIWEKILLVLDGELSYITMTGEDGFERIFPRAVLGEVVVRKGIPTDPASN